MSIQLKHAAKGAVRVFDRKNPLDVTLGNRWDSLHKCVAVRIVQFSRRGKGGPVPSIRLQIESDRDKRLFFCHAQKAASEKWQEKEANNFHGPLSVAEQNRFATREDVGVLMPS